MGFMDSTGPLGGSPMDRRSFIAGGCAGALALAGLMGTSGCANASATVVGDVIPSLRVGSDCSYPPYEMLLDHEMDGALPVDNIDGSWAAGYDINWVERLSKDLDRTLYIVNIRRDKLADRLRDGYVDMIVSAVAERPSGGEILYSLPYGSLDSAIMVAKDGPYADATDISQLAGARFVARGGTVLDSAIDAIPGVDHLPSTGNVGEACERILGGEADATVVDANAVSSYAKIHPGIVAVSLPAEQLPEIPGNGLSVAVRADDDDLLVAINEAIGRVGDAERQEMWDAAEALCQKHL